MNWSGKGNLLTHSAPSGNGWGAASKDHYESSPATITAYAIGIKPEIAGFGRIVTSLSINHEFPVIGHTGSRSLATDIPDGWVMTCPGAYLTWLDAGRLLWRIETDGNTVWAGSDDHIAPDYGRLSVYAVRIQKKNF